MTGGLRNTSGQPMSYDATIHFVGGSEILGLGADDEHTLPSCVQALLNEKKAENIYATSGFRMDMSKAEQIIEGISTIKTWAFDNLDVEMVVSQSGDVTIGYRPYGKPW